MSAAFPEVTPQYSSVSPLLADAVDENLSHFTKINKTLVELIQNVSSIHDEAAANLMTVVDVYNKKITDICKSKSYCQNESFVKFISRILEEIESQAKVLQTLSSSFGDCVIVPLCDAVEKKKEVWKTCFHYVETFKQQIRKKEDDLVKRYKDYSEASVKLKTSEFSKSKQRKIVDNAHNTYLLRLSSVNIINNLLYTHVLPHVLHSLEKNQGELNDSVRHHVKYMFSVQKDMLKKLTKSVDKVDHATDKIDLVSDVKKFIKSVAKAGMKDKNPPRHEFVAPKVDHSRRSNVAIESLEAAFVVNKSTRPNLQRRLASLQHQTGQLVESISSMRAGESEELATLYRSDDPSLNEIIELLCICDREANLNMLLKQMELYTPKVIDYLGPIPKDLLKERSHTKKSPTHRPLSVAAPTTENGEQPHEFAEPRVMKPISCFYCSKMIALIGKGFVCKVCRMYVHKKCATNVPFCDGTPIKQKLRSKSACDLTTDQNTERGESSTVFDLIDLESDDESYFDEDEFNDGLSDTEEDQDSYSIIAATLPQPMSRTPLSNKSVHPDRPMYNKPLPHSPCTDRRHSMLVFPTNHQLPPKPPSFVSPLTPNNVKKKNGPQSVKPPLAKKPTLLKKPANIPTPVSTPVRETSFCVALYNFRGFQNTDLSFTSGCIIELVEKSNDDWWQGKYKGFQGFFPSQYALEIDRNGTVLRSLYDFAPENDKELAVKEGQILVLIHKEDDWIMVQSFDGKGLIPSSYVEHL